MARKSPEKRVYVRHSARLAERIIDEISTGKHLDEICAEPGMPDRHTVRRWCIERPDFAERYETARRWSAYAELDELDDLVNRGQTIVEAVAKNGGNATAAASVLREQVNHKRWKISKLLPQFADRVTTELVGAGGKDLIPEPMDDGKLALALLGILNRGPGGKNDPAALEPSPAMNARATLLSGPPEPPEISGDPEPPMSPAAAREHIRYLNVIHGRRDQ